MPIFEFKCKDCGKVYEELILNGGDMPTRCKECGGVLVRLYNGTVGLNFKGAGFYVNDYGKGCSTCKVNENKGSDNK